MDFGLSSWLGYGEQTTDAAAEQEPAFKLESYPSADKVDYDAFVAASIDILLKRDTGEDNVTQWDLLSDEDGVETWSGTVQGTSWNAFRIVEAIRGTKEEVAKALMDVDVLLKLDEMTERIDVLHQTDDSGKITLRHCLSQGVFPFAAREFVLVTGMTDLPDGRIAIASRSLDIEDVPLFDPGYVRAIDIINGILIDQKTDDEGTVYCMVTLIGQADLGGYVPATVVNMVGTSATAKVLANLKEYLEDAQDAQEAS